MESSNPILNRYGRGYASMETGSDQDLEQLYNAPAASSIRTGRLTIDDVVTRTALLFGLLDSAFFFSLASLSRSFPWIGGLWPSS